MNTKTDCSHRLPFGLKWASRNCERSPIEGMQHRAYGRVRCVDCNEQAGILCTDCGRVY